jgi:hypothetical protein
MDPIGLSLEHFDAIGRWAPAGEAAPRLMSAVRCSAP